MYCNSARDRVQYYTFHPQEILNIAIIGNTSLFNKFLVFSTQLYYTDGKLDWKTELDYCTDFFPFWKSSCIYFSLHSLYLMIILPICGYIVLMVSLEPQIGKIIIK